VMSRDREGAVLLPVMSRDREGAVLLPRSLTVAALQALALHTRRFPQPIFRFAIDQPRTPSV